MTILNEIFESQSSKYKRSLSVKEIEIKIKEINS